MIFHFNCQYSRLKKLAKRYQKTHSPCVFLQGFCQTDHHLAHHLIGPIHFPRGSRKPMSYWSGKPRQLPSLQSPEGLRLGEFTDEVFLLYTTILVGGGLDRSCSFHPYLVRETVKRSHFDSPQQQVTSKMMLISRLFVDPKQLNQ